MLSTVSSGSESGSSLLLLGVVAGTVGFLLLLIAAVITVICVLRSRARNSGVCVCVCVRMCVCFERETEVAKVTSEYLQIIRCALKT